MRPARVQANRWTAFRRAGRLALALGVLPLAAQAEISIDAPRLLVAGQDLRIEAHVTDVPAKRKLRIFVLLDGLQTRTVDLGSGVHHLRFADLNPAPGRHEVAFQIGRERAVDSFLVVPWWGAVAAFVLPLSLLLLGVELVRKRRRRASP